MNGKYHKQNDQLSKFLEEKNIKLSRNNIRLLSLYGAEYEYTNKGSRETGAITASVIL